MREAATSAELQAAFAGHLEVTQKQIVRLKQVFEMLWNKHKAKNAKP